MCLISHLRMSWIYFYQSINSSENGFPMFFFLKKRRVISPCSLVKLNIINPCSVRNYVFSPYNFRFVYNLILLLIPCSFSIFFLDK
jgi:hypothetical protein